jgi:hypothetical protein
LIFREGNQTLAPNPEGETTMKKFLAVAFVLFSVFGVTAQALALPSQVQGTVTVSVTGIAEFTLQSFRGEVPAGQTTPVIDYNNDTQGNLDFGTIDAMDFGNYPDPQTNPYAQGQSFLRASRFYQVTYRMNNNINPYKVTVLFSDQGQANGLFANIKGPLNLPIMHMTSFPTYAADGVTIQTVNQNNITSLNTAVAVTPEVEQTLYNTGSTPLSDTFSQVIALDHIAPFNPSGTFTGTVTYTMQANL